MDQQTYNALKVAQTDDVRDALIDKILAESGEWFNISRHHLPLLKLQLSAAVKTLEVINQEVAQQGDVDHDFIQLAYLLSTLPQALRKVEQIEHRLASTS